MQTVDDSGGNGHDHVLLTAESRFDLGRVACHSPLQSGLQDLTQTIVVVTDCSEELLGGAGLRKRKKSLTIRSAELVMIARQCIWTEMFAQRVYSRLGSELLARLDPEDRQIFASLNVSSDNEDYE